MEKYQKNRAQGTYTTLKECSTDPEFKKLLDKIEESERRARKNNLYD